MNAKQEIQGLGAILAHDFVVVVKPDHPLLLVSPDILASKNGNLAAIFVLKADETQSPDKLLVRLALARLALPRHTRCILISDPLEPLLDDGLGSHFHKVFYTGNTKDLAAFIMDPLPNSRVKPIPIDIRRRTFQRFDALYAESEEHASIETENQESAPIPFEDELHNFPSIDIRSWTGQQSPFYHYPTIRNSDSILLAQFELGRGKALNKVRAYCNASCLLDYSFDGGIPYPREDSFWAAKILVVTNTPISRADPLKYIRAAAFAGWSFAQVRSVQDIHRIGKSIKARLEDLGHERLQ